MLSGNWFFLLSIKIHFAKDDVKEEGGEEEDKEEDKEEDEAELFDRMANFLENVGFVVSTGGNELREMPMIYRDL